MGSEIVGEDETAQMLQLLALRAEAIEKRLQGDAPDLNDPIERVKDHCDRVGALSVRFKWVPANYYSTTLDERARELGCAKDQLCKTMIMENKAFVEREPGSEDASDPATSRYYMVVVQYTAKLSPQKLSAAVMRMKPGGEKVSRARCNLQVAPEEVGLSLSGFPHNGVSVLGGLTPIPVILSKAVLSLRAAYMWMGGGHPLLKLGVSTSDLVNRLGAIVADISVPRDVSSSGVADDDSEL